MGQHWAIAIGINHYQRFQALQYARQDAEALGQFLRQEKGVPADRCIVLRETAISSASVGTVTSPLTLENHPDLSPTSNSLVDTLGTSALGTATVLQQASVAPDRPLDRSPQRDNILFWLQTIVHQVLQPDDVLWVFFSGYGVCYGGEDYLMPWDGDPGQVAETGLTVRSILHLLHGAPTSHLLLILDMNRSQGVLSPVLPGQRTLELADQFGITTLLSCQPDQFSHESAERRQGLFTVALLEGLRLHQLQTLGDLHRYVSDRLPELCEQHWRPLQQPVATGSPQLPLYPDPTLNRSSSGGDALVSSPTAPMSPVSIQGRGQTQPGTFSSDYRHQSPSPQPQAQSSPVASPQRPFSAESPAIVPPNPLRPEALPDDRPHPPASPFLSSTAWQELERVLTNPQLWLVVVGSLLVGLIGFKIWQLSQLPQIRQLPIFSFPQSSPPPSPPSSSPDSPASSPSSTPVPNSANQDGDSAAEVNANVNSEASNSASSAAIAALKSRNQRILLRARSLLQGVQASQLSEAIAALQTIEPGEPYYEEAQRDMNRWSALILDLAWGRVEGGDYAGAIAAAGLIPADRSNYKQAQEAIAYWQNLDQQQRTNQTYLDQARALLPSNSASAYNDAIALARNIPEGQPLFFEAQRLIGEWTRQILEIAEDRAAQGKYQDAILAAELIPPEMVPHYEVAQARIKTWRGQKF